MKGCNVMFYCIICSRLHHEKAAGAKVFKNGFYIDPFGKKIHLGMCVGKGGRERKSKDVLLERGHV